MAKSNLSLAQLKQQLKTAEIERSNGNYTGGTALALDVLEHARQQNMSVLEGEAMLLIAMQLRQQGKYQEAVQYCQSSINIWQHQQNIPQLARAFNEKAIIYVDLGLLDEALESLTQGTEAARITKDSTLLYWAYNRTGLVLSHLQKYDDAKNFLMRALMLAQDLGLEERFCILNNLSDFCVNTIRELFSNQKDHKKQIQTLIEEGLLHAQQAIKLARQSQNPYRESMVLCNYGALQAYNGDYSGARHNALLAQQLAQQNNYAALANDAELLIARISWLYGNTTEAICIFGNVLQEMIRQGDRLNILNMHMEMSQVYQEIGETAKALEHYKLYHEMERKQRSAIAASRARLMTFASELSDTRRELERIRMQSELKQLQMEESEAEKLALKEVIEDLNQKIHIDDLTCIWNRRFMMNQLKQAIEDQDNFCIALVDVDHFKKINDTYGHQRGDVMLLNLAQLIQRMLPEETIVARYGGEEFMILFHQRGLSDTYYWCNKIRQQVQSDETCQLNKTEFITISIGVAEKHTDDVLEALIERADKALYHAKFKGRNCVIQASA
ncbi:MAG: diguanylate cyclase [Reinekea sp.]|jgi:diguanylate cyclase (GGDEF)-like protein